MERLSAIAVPVTVRLRLALLGAALTCSVAVGTLLLATYRAERCFNSPSGFGGCEYFQLGFLELAGRFPVQLLGPGMYLALLCILAVASAWQIQRHGEARVMSASLAAAYAVLAIPAAYALRPLFIPAALFVLGAHAASVPDLVAATLAASVAWLTLPALLAQMSFRLPPIFGLLDLLPAYWLFATALGLGAGAIAAAAGRQLALLRGLVGAHLTLALSALIAHVPLVPFFYPRGIYENIGGPGIFVVAFWLAVPNLLLGPLSLRLFLNVPWRTAFAGTIIAFAGAVVGFLVPMMSFSIARTFGGP